MGPCPGAVAGVHGKAHSLPIEIDDLTPKKFSVILISKPHGPIESNPLLASPFGLRVHRVPAQPPEVLWVCVLTFPIYTFTKHNFHSTTSMNLSKHLQPRISSLIKFGTPFSTRQLTCSNMFTESALWILNKMNGMSRENLDLREFYSNYLTQDLNDI